MQRGAPSVRSALDSRAMYAVTEHRADTPTEGATRHPSGGVPRSGPISTRDADVLLEYLANSAGPGLFLRLIIEHVADGGIIIEHAGGLVLTWPDGGASRRITRSGDT